jgi:hypothetical protein
MEGGGTHYRTFSERDLPGLINLGGLDAGWCGITRLPNYNPLATEFHNVPFAQFFTLLGFYGAVYQYLFVRNPEIRLAAGFDELHDFKQIIEGDKFVVAQVKFVHGVRSGCCEKGKRRAKVRILVQMLQSAFVCVKDESSRILKTVESPFFRDIRRVLGGMFLHLMPVHVFSMSLFP